MFIAVEQQPAGVGGLQLVARQDLLALEAHEALDPGGDALDHGDRFFAADGQDRPGCVITGERLEVVGRHGDPAVLRSDPALAKEKTGHRAAAPGRCSVSYQSWNSSSAARPMFIAAIRVPWPLVEPSGAAL